MPGWLLVVIFLLLGAAIGLSMRMIVRLLVYHGESGGNKGAFCSYPPGEEPLRSGAQTPREDNQ